MSSVVNTTYSIDFKYRALVVIALVPALCYVSRHYQLDDALIYARYIRHALQGQGLVFNAGESVNART